jgi:hypothetical protein
MDRQATGYPRMSAIYNDYRPEVRSLLNRLDKAGFKFTGGDNGEENSYDNPREFVEDLTATDESWAYISRDGHKFSLFLV